MDKDCIICGTSFAKTPKESSKQWSSRKVCGYACAGVNNSRLLEGRTYPERVVSAKVREAARLVGLNNKGENSALWKDGRASVENRKTYYKLKGIERRAIELKADGSFTHEEWLAIKQRFGCKCAHCKQPETLVRLTIDHVVPLTKGGTNWASNLQPLCQPCNSRKGNRI